MKYYTMVNEDIRLGLLKTQILIERGDYNEQENC